MMISNDPAFKTEAEQKFAQTILDGVDQMQDAMLQAGFEKYEAEARPVALMTRMVISLAAKRLPSLDPEFLPEIVRACAEANVRSGAASADNIVDGLRQ